MIEWVGNILCYCGSNACNGLLSTERLGVGGQIILAAILVMRVSLVRFLTDSMLKKQMEQ